MANDKDKQADILPQNFRIKEVARVYNQNTRYLPVKNALNFSVENLGDGTDYLEDVIPLAALGSDKAVRLFAGHGDRLYGQDMKVSWRSTGTRKILVIATVPIGLDLEDDPNEIIDGYSKIVK